MEQILKLTIILGKPLNVHDLFNKIKAIKKFKDKNNLKRPVIKVQGISSVD